MFMKIQYAFFIVSIWFFSSCKKGTGEADNSKSYVNATIDGKNYSSNNITVIRTANTNDLFSFSGTTPESISIGIDLDRQSPPYDPGSYTVFTASSIKNALLTSFTIKDSSSIALLQWITSQEFSLSFFSIERSVDGNSFTEIGQVTSAGNPNSDTKYFFTDYNNNTVKNYYYRLKMENLDGSYNYSAAIAYNDLNATAYYSEGSAIYKGMNGSIEIKSNDKTKRVVNGSFSFDIKYNNGQVKQIRNGTFNVLY